MAFESLVNRASQNIELSDGLGLDEIYLLRKEFFRLWYSEDTYKRYPNLLYDYINKSIKEGQFETYNYWIFSNGNPEAFQNWLQSNANTAREYLKWREANVFKFDDPEVK
jgi:hemolysin-activating ACP:hemolysin acyltransferase